MKLKMTFLMFFILVSSVSALTSRDHLVASACRRNPELSFCVPGGNAQAGDRLERDFIDDRPHSRASNTDDNFDDIPEPSRPRSRSRSRDGNPNAPKRPPTAKLQRLCTRFYPLAVQHCGRQQLTKHYVAKCMAYFRDCDQFIPKGDPLDAISNSFTSGVGLNLGSWEVKGLPFYPINEEGAFGAGHYANVPFGAWGGGFSDNLGVRDYWSQTFDVGANWIEGRYGYRTGWSVPLVQSLGVEGGGGTDVNVPIRPEKLGTIDVDNHYGVGGYYKHNQHTGVDWKDGRVESSFGVGVPFAGVGVNTGTAVSFPSIGDFLPAGRR